MIKKFIKLCISENVEGEESYPRKTGHLILKKKKKKKKKTLN